MDQTTNAASSAAALCGCNEPPYNLEIEGLILGALLQDFSQWYQLAEKLTNVGLPMLEEQDFVGSAHKVIFKVLHEMALEQVPQANIPIVAARLENGSYFDRLGRPLVDVSYLYCLSNSGGGEADASLLVEYTKSLKALTWRRTLIDAASNVIDSSYMPYGQSSEQLLTQASGAFDQLATAFHNQGTLPQNAVESMMGLISSLEEKSVQVMQGIQTGFKDVDSVLYGLHGGSLNVLAARPRVGKTALALNIATNVASNQQYSLPVLFFSMEMSQVELSWRQLSALTHASIDDLKANRLNPAQITKAVHGINSMKRDLPKVDDNAASSMSMLYIIEDGIMTPSKMRSIVNSCHQKFGGVSLIVLDYLQMLQPDIVPNSRSYRALELGEISAQLKQIAKDFNAPILALAQLNREVDKRPNKRPCLGDIRDSGAIEQTADVVMFLHRDAVYKRTASNEHKANLFIAKNRNGTEAEIELSFYGAFNLFCDSGYVPYAAAPASQGVVINTD